MTDNFRSSSLRPAGPSGTSKKQHDLKMQKVLAFRAKCRQQRYHNKIKRRKHALAHIDALSGLMAINHNMHAKPVYKTNIHSMFYVKPARKSTEPTHGYILKMSLQ